MTTLQIKQLGYQIDHEWLWQALNFTLHEDDWVTIIGQSGGGKSTLLKVLAALQDATTGEILLDGVAINELPIGEYRQMVSYAAQSAQLFGETVRENLDLPFIVRQLAPDENRQIVGLAKMQLDASYLDKAVTELSGGQRQRIGVLRNLLFMPKVLLLDEISTGLDADTKAVIWDYIRQLQAESHPIILSVTHDESEIAQAKQVFVLEHGQGGFQDDRSN